MLTAILVAACCASTSGFGPVEGSGKLSCPSIVFLARVCTCVTSEVACMAELYVRGGCLNTRFRHGSAVMPVIGAHITSKFDRVLLYMYLKALLIKWLA